MNDENEGRAPGPAGPFENARDEPKKPRPARRPECDRAISLAQAARFVLALRDGETVAAAAAAAGVAVSTFYYRRRIDADFAACWAEAVAGAAVDAGAARAGERRALDGAQGTKVVPHARRWLVRRRRAPVELTRARRQAVLDHFAQSCNLEASAAAAGVSVSAVYRGLARDPAFAEGLKEALRMGYERAEEDSLCEAMVAQEAYRIAPCEETSRFAFDRAMAVLREYKRGFGKIGRRPYKPAVLDHEAGFAALERALDAFVRREALRERPAIG